MFVIVIAFIEFEKLNSKSQKEVCNIVNWMFVFLIIQINALGVSKNKNTQLFIVTNKTSQNKHFHIYRVSGKKYPMLFDF